jgi:hypothetical protein
MTANTLSVNVTTVSLASIWRWHLVALKIGGRWWRLHIIRVQYGKNFEVRLDKRGRWRRRAKD